MEIETMQAAKLFAHIEQKYFLVSTTTYKLGVMAWIRSLFVAFLSWYFSDF